MKLEKKYSIFMGEILCGYNLIDKIFGASYVVLLVSRGISKSDISFLMAISSLSLFIFDYPSGNIADIFGRKKTTSLGFFSWGLGLIIYSLSKTFMQFLTAFIVISLGVALISGAPEAWYVDKLSEIGKTEYKNRIFPILSGLMSLFAGLGAILSSLSNNFTKASLSITAAGAVAIVLAVYTHLKYDDNRGKIQTDNIFKEMIVSTKAFIRDKSMNKLLVYYLIKGIPFNAFIIIWQIYALEELSVKPAYIGLMLTVFMVIQSLSGFLSGKLVQRFGNFQLSLTGSAIMSMSFFLIYTFAKTSIAYFALVSLLEFGIGILAANSIAWIQDLIPSSKRSTYSSALTAINSGFNFITALLFGLIIRFYDIGIIWIVAGAVQMVSALYLKKSISPLLVNK